MIRLVESANAGKAKIVGTADRWATWTVAIALLTAVTIWFATGKTIRSATTLIVFCLCALVLATSTATMAGIGNATRLRVLVREGDALEWSSQAKRTAFDKTDILTYGEPVITQIYSIDDTLGEKALLTLVASSELRSEHPLGRVTIARYRQRYDTPSEQSETFELLAGRGVVTQVAGRKLLAGNKALTTERKVTMPEALLSLSENMKRNGRIVIYIIEHPRAIGIAALSDTLRSNAAQTIGAIYQAGVRTALLTGGVAPVTSHIAASAGLRNMQIDCSPENKLEEIHAYQKTGESVCMVGDGINDAPTPKAAFVGTAVGDVGSDITIDMVDVVLVSDDIKEVPYLLRLPQKTMHTIKINLAASMALNFVVITLAITGVLTPIIDALVHNAGSVAVIIHSLLSLKWRKIK